MRTTRLLFVAGILLCSASLFADGLVKFKNWDNTPQGYFMTKAEHQQWAAIRTDDEAQRFVDSFLAKRDPGFAAEAALRADHADKLLTIGNKIPGSKTLRGKVVILLGPPSGLDVSESLDKGAVHRDSPAMAAAMSGGSNSQPGEVDGNEGSQTMGSANLIRNYHFTYASTPAGPLEVMIAADPNNGKDRPRGRDDSKRLDAAFEAAAQASIKTK
jgi:GWxTD domain-containing protein